MRAVAPVLMAAAVLLGTGCGDEGPRSSPATTTDRLSIDQIPDTTTGTVPPERTLALSAASTVSTVGLDDVFFGMTLDEAQDAAGASFTVIGSATSPCFRANPDAGPPGITFTFVDGRVERVDVTEAPVATRSGAHVGTAEAELRRLYPDQLAQVPRDDGKPGNQLVFVPRDAEDAEFRLVFRTDGTMVTDFHAGRLPVAEREPPC